MFHPGFFITQGNRETEKETAMDYIYLTANCAGGGDYGLDNSGIGPFLERCGGCGKITAFLIKCSAV